VVANPKRSEVVNAFDDGLPDRLRAQMERAGFVVDFRRGLTRNAHPHRASTRAKTRRRSDS